MTQFVLLAAVVSTTALAQTTAPGSDENIAPPPPPSVNLPDDAPLEDPGGRIRWGVSGKLGWNVPSPAFTMGGEGRVGWQLSKIFSAYLAIGGTGGFGFGVKADFEGAAIQITALSYYYFAALAELYLGNLFFVAAGPVLANGAFVGATLGASADGVAEQRNIVATGITPGVDIRLGLGFPGAPRASFRRMGFNIGLDAMILFHPDSIITTVRADGPNGSASAGVKSNGLTVSVVPMLMLGYDMR
ncbi:MAG: hypothetical protein K1X64_18675 [Myxococcaceae bacterium]|nr:hypothetical protein [Myxococcaceae bacterium]